jgi:hypothetical protein
MLWRGGYSTACRLTTLTRLSLSSIAPTCKTDPLTIALIQGLQNSMETRSWQQHHSPKNLALSLTGEMGELMGIDVKTGPKARVY